MAREPEPVRITSASRSHSDDIWAREKRYMWTMGIRTACFIAAAVSFMAGLPLWLVWTLMGGSLVLPYIAVVMANAGVSPDPGGPEFFDGNTGTAAIEPRPDAASDDPDSTENGHDS